MNWPDLIWKVADAYGWPLFTVVALLGALGSVVYVVRMIKSAQQHDPTLPAMMELPDVFRSIAAELREIHQTVHENRNALSSAIHDEARTVERTVKTEAQEIRQAIALHRKA